MGYVSVAQAQDKPLVVLEFFTSQNCPGGAELEAVLEDVVAAEYAKRTGFKIEKPTGLIRHKQYPFIVCNLDYWVDFLFMIQIQVLAMMKNVQKNDFGKSDNLVIFAINLQYN